VLGHMKRGARKEGILPSYGSDNLRSCHWRWRCLSALVLLEMVSWEGRICLTSPHSSQEYIIRFLLLWGAELRRTVPPHLTGESRLVIHFKCLSFHMLRIRYIKV
jgi:hypothetical protein